MNIFCFTLLLLVVLLNQSESRNNIYFMRLQLHVIKYLRYLIYTLIIYIFYHELVVSELCNRRIDLYSFVRGLVIECFSFYFYFLFFAGMCCHLREKVICLLPLWNLSFSNNGFSLFAVIDIFLLWVYICILFCFKILRNMCKYWLIV